MSGIRVEFLKTKVARRLFGFFVTLAVGPVAVLAVVSWYALLSELEAQALDNMHGQNRIAGQMVIARLDRTQQDLLNVRRLRSASASFDALPPSIRGVAIVTAEGVQEERGDTLSPPPLDAVQEQSIRIGIPVLVAEASTSGARVLMAIPADSIDPTRGVLWAGLTVDSLLASAIVAVDGQNTGNFCVLDSRSRPLTCTSENAYALPALVPPYGDSLRINSDDFELEFDEQVYLGEYREVFFGGRYLTDPWAVAISESTESIYASLEIFRINFPFGLLGGLAAAVLSTVLIVRRMMDPLEQLTEGTRRISRRDLSARVRIASDNEFGELAASFNEMASHIGRQFDQLDAGRAIDQAALNAPDHADAVAALLKGVGKVVSSSQRSVLILEARGPDIPELYWAEGPPDAPMQTSALVQGGGGGSTGTGSHLLVQEWDDLPGVFQSSGFTSESLPVLVLPLVVHGDRIGEVAAGGNAGRVFTDEDVDRARQLVDQAAVALNDVRLRRELSEISWEALRALANAIDAKSQWTSGHSQRVTDLAVLLGQELDLSEKDIELLHRGGLLHDIGKIGIPATILDFPGRLDDEQRAVMQSHTVIGARILAPVRAFQPMIPIVLHHHEHWNGKGYPEGLAGDEIPALARVVSVADVFDALVSARPYRGAMDPDKIHDIIVSESGTQFEPRVVEAFQRVVAAGFTPSVSEEVLLVDV